MLFEVGTDDGHSGMPVDPSIANNTNYIAYVNATIRTRGYLREFPAAADAALTRVRDAMLSYPSLTSRFFFSLSFFDFLKARQDEGWGVGYSSTKFMLTCTFILLS